MVVVYLFIGVLVSLLIVMFVTPQKYEVRRSLVIKRPIEDVFLYLKFIKNQDEWSPWKKKDPTMKQSYVGTDGEVGFITKWEGNKDVGMGEQEILNITENESVISKLRFFKPWKSESDAYLKLEKFTEAQTEVTWGFMGKNPMPFNVFMLFFNMEKTVGNDFLEGLYNLKRILEK
ncbi:SRPBCC family protein [Mariniflexile sp. AS56]|nr:SRPBCC family protein [Mariniflexile sp. AS56]MDO7170603.1 SRPBCC family protein [Mariniflexile sp. AS56]